MPFVSGSELNKLPEKCRYLNSRLTTAYKEGFSSFPTSHYCDSARKCEYLDKVDYDCPIIEYAREYESIIAGKCFETAHYAYYITGFNSELKCDTYSLLLKHEVKEVEVKHKPKHSPETIDEVERLLGIG
jgi:hypothetical protein